MRYKNWDVLMFPERSKVPVQEFKTSCHVVQDSSADCAPIRNNMVLVPTITCFVPALRPGQPFRLSIHSWETPEPSQFLRDYSKHADQVVFEARVFVDGRMAGYRYFGRDGPWPAIIDSGLTIDKNGEIDPLSFPTFHKELLTQNYWNAGDDLGRIRVVISEGFPRESTALPYERIKSVVAFSFQHAPLDVLEASSIAWPNASMWRQVSFAAGSSFPTRTNQRNASEPGVDAHSHSPRRPRSGSHSRSQLPPPGGMMLPPAMPSVPRAPIYDPFTDDRGPVWRQASASSAGASLDVSMPDYSSSSGMSQANHSRRTTDPLGPERERDSRRYQSLQSQGAVDSLCEALRTVRDSRSTSHENTGESTGPTINTPTTGTLPACEWHQGLAMRPVLTSPAANESGIRVPPPTMRMASVCSENGRVKKEATAGTIVLSDDDQEQATTEPRHSLFSLTSSAGNKRQKVVSGATRVIDPEDEPKNDPLSRNESSTHLQENKEN